MMNVKLKPNKILQIITLGYLLPHKFPTQLTAIILASLEGFGYSLNGEQDKLAELSKNTRSTRNILQKRQKSFSMMQSSDQPAIRGSGKSAEKFERNYVA